MPLLLDPEPAPFGTLIGHLARPNPQAREAIGDALAIFLGPEGYITPSYYATKRETGKVVPTWNYTAIHAYGRLRFIDDRAELLDIVTRLTDRHENRARRALGGHRRSGRFRPGNVERHHRLRTGDHPARG